MQSDPELWFYILVHHKTERYFDDDKIIPLGKAEQHILEPYLTDKKPNEAVFSPRQSVAERKAERRAARKSKIPPSQELRDMERAVKPRQYAEFYNKDSYHNAVEYAIKKGNKQLPERDKIPAWFPYQLRHTAGTETSRTAGREKAQALLTHATIATTGIYDHFAGHVRCRF